MTVEIRRGTRRFTERGEGKITQHAFSFGAHYDAEHVGFGPLVCHDEHVLGAGRGFDLHRHAGLHVVSYVVAGTLLHSDDSGAAPTPVPAGSVAHLVAADGVQHAEHASPDGVCRFVQVWLPDGGLPAAPSYRVLDGGPLSLDLPAGPATLDVVHLPDGATTTLPAGTDVAPLVHVFLASGALVRSSLAEPLAAGDAFLMTDEPAHDVVAAVDSTLLVWRLPGRPPEPPRPTAGA